MQLNAPAISPLVLASRLTFKESALYLSVSVSTIYNLVNNNKIKSFESEKVKYILLTDLHSFLALKENKLQNN